jgi:integrase/recombinase XerD
MSDTNTAHDIDTDELLSGFEAQLTKSKSDSTVSEYTRHARDYIQWVESHGIPLFGVKPSEVKDHLGETLEQGYAPGYLKIRRAAIRSLYDEAYHIAESRTTDGLEGVDPEDIEGNPADPERMTMDFSDLDKGSKQSQAAKEDYVAVDAGDVRDMLENVPPSHAKGEDHRLLLKLLFYTGLRKSEVVRIKLSDFDDPDTFRGERSINIRAIKTDSNRTVYYPPEVVSDLDSWVNGVGRELILGSRESEYLFPSPDMAPDDDDEHISHQHVNWVVKESAKGAGIQEPMYTDMNGNTRWKVTAHSLRHGFAESCIEEGMDLRTLAELMGHFKKDGTPAIETTTMYLKGIDNGEQYEQHGPPSVDTDSE